MLTKQETLLDIDLELFNTKVTVMQILFMQHPSSYPSHLSCSADQALSGQCSICSLVPTATRGSCQWQEEVIFLQTGMLERSLVSQSSCRQVSGNPSLASSGLRMVTGFYWTFLLPLLLLVLHPRTSLVVQMAKNLPTVQETQVWSLGQEDTLENGPEFQSQTQLSD